MPIVPDKLAEELSSVPLDYVLLGLVSLLVIGVANYELKRVLSALVKDLPLSELTEEEEEEDALFALPFALSLGFGIDDTVSDRPPTAEEYEIIRGLVAGWLHQSMAAYYAGNTKSSFVRVKVVLNRNKTFWNPATSKGFPHQICLDCQAIFYATEATQVPDQVSFAYRFFSKLGYRPKCVPAIKYTGPGDCIFRFATSYGTNIETKGNPRRFAPGTLSQST